MGKRLCPVCEKNNTTKDMCNCCRQKKIMTINCRSCHKEVIVTFVKYKVHIKKGGKYCKECCKKISSETMKRTRSRETKEERSIRSIKAYKSKTKDSFRKGTLKQWETIRNTPHLWENMQKQRAIQGKINWDIKTDEAKKRQLEKWLKPKSRSMVSESLKHKMIEENLYNGFESEQVFHGFVPDEINHDLKIIVEMYGDLYHCNPRKYKNEDIYIKAIKRTVGEQWKRDRIRLACFYKHGYTVIVVWEKDFYKNPQIEIGRIKDEINKKREIRSTI